MHGFEVHVLLCFFFRVVIAWEIRRTVIVFQRRCSRNIKIVGVDFLVGNWITSVRYCYAAEAVHDDAYHKVELKLFFRAFPPQTIDGIKVDGMNETGSVSQKTFRYHARLHLPDSKPLLKIRLDEALAAELTTCGKENGWTRISASSTINRITQKVNNVILLGDKLGTGWGRQAFRSMAKPATASETRFFEDAVGYTQHTAVCEELL
ncbi:MAG: hypothetical protein LQ344_004843 [Seirophora lacunosa]|nr:MAG: hypothetical protein LQ344_004843 [Seirophora lacunosa]